MPVLQHQAVQLHLWHGRLSFNLDLTVSRPTTSDACTQLFRHYDETCFRRKRWILDIIQGPRKSPQSSPETQSHSFCFRTTNASCKHYFQRLHKKKEDSDSVSTWRAKSSSRWFDRYTTNSTRFKLRTMDWVHGIVPRKETRGFKIFTKNSHQ